MLTEVNFVALTFVIRATRVRFQVKNHLVALDVVALGGLESVRNESNQMSDQSIAGGDRA